MRQIRRAIGASRAFVRHQSFKAAGSSNRENLHKALGDLRQFAPPGYINVSRLQLALRGLEEEPGKETIRIGILGDLQKGKELARLVFADPLKQEEEWERRIIANDADIQPTLIHVDQEHDAPRNRLVQEIHLESPLWKGTLLELLVWESASEDVLVPTMMIPTGGGRQGHVTMPLHRVILLSRDILGKAMRRADVDPAVAMVLDSKAVCAENNVHHDQGHSLSIIDTALGTEALHVFRDNIENALVYERDWFASGLPKIVEWIKAGTTSTPGVMKEPLRTLIESIITDATIAIEAERDRTLSTALSTKVSTTALADNLRGGLAQWAERAHTELRDQLDIAFEGKRWRKLGWWKLFWQVDDVSMIATDILKQRFLKSAEEDIIFVSGCMAQAGFVSPGFGSVEVAGARRVHKALGEKRVLKASFSAMPAPPMIREILDTPQDEPTVVLEPRPWPLDIQVKRDQLCQESVLALQALGQKLVIQTLSTSSLASALASLMYISSISTGLYEAGAVAAVGIVWSLRRMQGKWESARKFWEGEVREEGRKAVRSVETRVGDLLKVPDQPLVVDPELEKAYEAAQRAKEALDKIT